MTSAKSRQSLLLRWLGTFCHPSLSTKVQPVHVCQQINFQIPGMSLTPTTTGAMKVYTVKLYIEKIIVPFIQKKKDELKLPNSQRALCIIDGFKAQCTREVVKLLDHHGIDIVYVPVNCTGELQPLDLRVNKPVKDFIRQKFQECYSSQIVSQKGDSDNITPITSFPFKEMKSLGAQWMMGVVDYLLANPTIITNGFHAAGIVMSH